jgi:hypothetical protein
MQMLLCQVLCRRPFLLEVPSRLPVPPLASAAGLFIMRSLWPANSGPMLPATTTSNVEGACNDGPVKSIPQYHSKTPRFKIVVGLRENSWPTENINKTVQKNFVATGTATSCPWVPKVG